MNSSRTAHRTRLRRQAFTLVEVTVAAALIGIVGLTGLSVLRSSAVLSSQNAGINISASRAREVIDQVNERARYALEQPALINNDGTVAGGTTADGLLIKKYIGGPYIVKDSGGGTGDIASTATQFVLEYRAGLPDPVVGDFVLMDSVTRPEREISATSNLTASGTMLRKLVTTTATVGEAIRPSVYRIAANLYRKEAYVFLPTDSTGNPRFELRHFPRVVASTVYSASASSKQLGDGFRRFTSLPFFTSTTSNGAPTIILRALANSSNRQEVIARGSTVSTFTTVPLQVRLWSVNR